MAQVKDYQVADITLAGFGKLEVELAEVEMPGLMELRKKYPNKPLKGAKISGSLHMTIQTAVLIDTLKELGADVRWCSCNIFSTQDHAAAYVAESGTPVYAWKGETLEEYWFCTLKAVTFPDGSGPDMIVDDGGDMTLLVHEGVKAEREYAKNKTIPNPKKMKNKEFACVVQILADSIKQNPQKWTKYAENMVGVSEETTTGVHRLYKLEREKKLLMAAINVNDSVTKQKFDNIYGCRHSLADGIFRGTDVMLGGKTVLICGYGDVGKGCVDSMKGAGARVLVSEIDPICALQACMCGLEVVRLKDVISDIDVVITATGNKNIVTAKDMSKMKNNSIVGNIGHFDNEIDMEGLENWPKIEKKTIKPQVHRWIFPDGHGVIVLAEGRLLNLGCATGHPSFVMSCSFTNQVLAQLDLWKERKGNKYEKGHVYVLPKELDEMVARLHLNKLGAKLTVLSKDQADYIDVSVDGPYKHNKYRY